MFDLAIVDIDKVTRKVVSRVNAKSLLHPGLEVQQHLQIAASRGGCYFQKRASGLGRGITSDLLFFRGLRAQHHLQFAAGSMAPAVALEHVGDGQPQRQAARRARGGLEAVDGLQHGWAAPPGEPRLRGGAH